jgi:hypothetical protein
LACGATYALTWLLNYLGIMRRLKAIRSNGGDGGPLSPKDAGALAALTRTINPRIDKKFKRGLIKAEALLTP